MSRRTILATLCVLLFAVAGCVPHVRVQIMAGSSVSYTAAQFSVAQASRDGLAMLPIVSRGETEGYRRQFATGVADSAQARRPAFMPWSVTMDRINGAALAEPYMTAIQAYRETSVLDHGVLSRIGEATGCRWLLFLVLDRKDKVDYVGEIRVESTEVTAYCQIWDTAAGDVAWESSAFAVAPKYLSDETRPGKYRPSTPEEVSAALAREVVAMLCVD